MRGRYVDVVGWKSLGAGGSSIRVRVPPFDDRLETPVRQFLSSEAVSETETKFSLDLSKLLSLLSPFFGSCKVDARRSLSPMTVEETAVAEMEIKSSFNLSRFLVLPSLL